MRFPAHGDNDPRILLSFAPFSIFVPGDPLFRDQFLSHASNAQRHGIHYSDLYRIILLKTTFRTVDSSHAKEIIYDHWLNMTFRLLGSTPTIGDRTNNFKNIQEPQDNDNDGPSRLPSSVSRRQIDSNPCLAATQSALRSW
jgi:hypothetical protein